MNAVDNDSCMHDAVPKDVKWSVVTEKHAGVGGGNEVVKVALITHEVLGGAGVEVPC